MGEEDAGEGNQATHKGGGDQVGRWTFCKREGEEAVHGGKQAVSFGPGHLGVEVQGGRAMKPFQHRTLMKPFPSGWHARGSVRVRKSSKASTKAHMMSLLAMMISKRMQLINKKWG